jgi:hypothetical protein
MLDEEQAEVEAVAPPPVNRRVARARARAKERERLALERAQRIYELLGGDDDGFDDEDW